MPGEMMKELNILTRRMKNLEHIRIDQKVKERREVKALGEGVDDHRFIGAADLDQAENGPIGFLAHELRIDGDIFCAPPTVAIFGQLGAFGDNRDTVHGVAPALTKSAATSSWPRNFAAISGVFHFFIMLSALGSAPCSSRKLTVFMRP